MGDLSGESGEVKTYTTRRLLPSMILGSRGKRRSQITNVKELELHSESKEVLCTGASLFRGRGVCPVSSLSRGFSVQGGLCPRGSLSRETPCTGKSGQYTSYWNAFLFTGMCKKFKCAYFSVYSALVGLRFPRGAVRLCQFSLVIA